MRRVVDANRHKISDLRRQVEDDLFHNHSMLPRFHPVFPNEVKLVCEMEFCHRPPNDRFADKDRTGLKAKFLDKKRHGDLLLDGKRPDLDNMVKLVLDPFEGIMHTDDSQVTKTVALKAIDMQPPHEGRTEICLHAVNPSSTTSVIAPRGRRHEVKCAPKVMGKTIAELSSEEEKCVDETFCSEGLWCGVL